MRRAMQKRHLQGLLVVQPRIDVAEVGPAQVGFASVRGRRRRTR